jgi:hypothetical protein
MYIYYTTLYYNSQACDPKSQTKQSTNCLILLYACCFCSSDITYQSRISSLVRKHPAQYVLLESNSHTLMHGEGIMDFGFSLPLRMGYLATRCTGEIRDIICMRYLVTRCARFHGANFSGGIFHNGPHRLSYTFFVRTVAYLDQGTWIHSPYRPAGQGIRHASSASYEACIICQL